VSKEYPIRYIARVILEAATPLSVGTGSSSLESDKEIIRDINGLPMIPGTGLTGVLRELADSISLPTDDLFGYQKKNTDEGFGSRLIISDALMIGEDGDVHDGLASINWKSPFYSRFKALPLRDHCRIDHYGKADSKGRGKFDELVVYRGARFVFDLELIGKDADSDNWEKLLSLISSPLFRAGGGARKGFGGFSTISIHKSQFNLAIEDELNKYINRSSELTVQLNSDEKSSQGNDICTSFELNLTPDDFFMFGAGFGDTDADDVYKTEEYITWDVHENVPRFAQKTVLIPASSVKGALSHRVAFHYNQIKGNYAQQHELLADLVGEKNEAVKALFGSAKDDTDRVGEGQRGIVIIDDVFLDVTEQPETSTGVSNNNSHVEKVFNHVSIDRFTGGSIDSALFSQKVVSAGKNSVKIKMVVPRKEYELLDEDVKISFVRSLKDITTGLLPLGGSVMKGHGCFSGNLTCDGEVL